VARWYTPEELIKIRKRKKMILYISIPLIGSLIGILITFALSML